MLRPPKPFALLARLSQSLSPRFGSVKSEQVRRRDDVDPLAVGGAERGWRAEGLHPWLEWAALMDRLVKRGYLDRGSASGNASKDSNHIRTACLNFAREHSDLIRCNFMNFAKNINCLSCNGLFEDRLRKLHEDLQHLPLKKGDWICKKCNFLNFAKNSKCLQCLEPPMRELTPGEWECLSCHYINFRRNMLCLKCNWKRPKVSASGETVAETPYTRPENTSPGTRPISIGRHTGNHFFHQRTLSEEENVDVSSSDEDRARNDNSGEWCKLNEFDDFPIVGGKGVTSRDRLVRERWKEAMLRKSKGISESSTENNWESSFAKFCNKELDEGSDDDDIAAWFK